MSNTPDRPHFAQLRVRMVEHQIFDRGVTHPRVLEAMKRVPRHLFVEENQQSEAYSDGPLPIGNGQTISQPYIVGMMSAWVDAGPGTKILEIGTGSGYQTAVLAEMGAEVFTIELHEALASRARNVLKMIGYDARQIHFRTSDGHLGWPEAAPFNSVMATCAPNHVPLQLANQLVEGGVMVLPLGEPDEVQTLTCLRKENGQLSKEKSFEVRFVPMVR